MAEDRGPRTIVLSVICVFRGVFRVAPLYGFMNTSILGAQFLAFGCMRVEHLIVTVTCHMQWLGQTRTVDTLGSETADTSRFGRSAFIHKLSAVSQAADWSLMIL
jgi:hypothetical protein